MKKAMMLFGAALWLVTAQGYAQTPLQIGVAGGVTIATVTGDDFEDADSRTAPYFGGTLVLQPTSNLGFETGLLYVSKGAKGSEDGGTVSFKFNYIEVPLLLRIGFMQASPIRPHLLLGGSVAFNAGCKVEVEFEGASAEVDCDQLTFEEFDFAFDTKSVDFGASAGLGVDIPVGARTVLTPSARYTLGLTDAMDIEDADGKNSAFQIGVALRIKL